MEHDGQLDRVRYFSGVRESQSASFTISPSRRGFTEDELKGNLVAIAQE